MFDTIKSKILFLTVAILLILTTVLSFTAYANLKNDKELIIQGYDYSIYAFVDKINDRINEMSNNVSDLALMGEVYYRTGKSENLSEYMVKNIFKIYKNSLGGGIWFEPYMVNPQKKYTCVYAFRNKNNEILIDNDYETEIYDYLNRSWYKEIMPKLSKSNPVVWSKPYYEEQGGETIMTTVGAGIYENGKLIGLSTVDWEISSIIKTISDMQPTKNSFTLFADKENDYIIASTDKYTNNHNLMGKSLKEISWYKDNMKNKSRFTYHNTNYISYPQTLNNGMILIVNIPEMELFGSIINHIVLIFLVLLTAVLVTFIALYRALSRNINQPIDKLTELARKISSGNLDTKIEISEPKEFAELASTFNKMTDSIKEYIFNISKINSEKAKMASDLAIAKKIQYSALPNTFYPDKKEFSIYASMETAKEVGGDFYDLFFIKPNLLMYLIADVSGKGIPAALFMMTTKTLIKNLAVTEKSPQKLIEKINNQICENNEQGFFITLFAGIIDTTTGKTTYLNCGHNPPLVKKKNGKFEYLGINSNLVLGAMPNVPYVAVETNFEKGDTIFLYTDGVTEALDVNEILYGEDRLIECINKVGSNNVKDIIEYVRKDVKKYTEGAEQSDDITMLCFKYNGVETLPQKVSYSIIANLKNYELLHQWLVNTCEQYELSISLITKIELITEEIYTNICKYAYPEEKGGLEFVFERINGEIKLTFIDMGIEYNPLTNENPDISLSAEERNIGGLGLYMVKQSVNKMDYKYENKQNILILTLTENS